jgi:hypothetical protein
MHTSSGLFTEGIYLLMVSNGRDKTLKSEVVGRRSGEWRGGAGRKVSAGANHIGSEQEICQEVIDNTVTDYKRYKRLQEMIGHCKRYV